MAIYKEPVDYIPKELRKKYKVGEYSDIYKDEKKEIKKTEKNKGKKKK